MMTSTGTRSAWPDDAAARTDVLRLPGGPRGHVAPPAPRHARPQPVSVVPRPAGAPPVGVVGVGGPLSAPVLAPARPGLRWGWLAIGVAAAVLAVAGLVSFAAAHSTMTVQGTVAVYGYGMSTPGSLCSQPMAQGMPVTVYDASGSLVGTTVLTGSGVSRDTWNTYYSSSDSCEYTFSVPGVTTSSSYYRVKIGSGEHDGVGFGLDQLRAGPIAMTLR